MEFVVAPEIFDCFPGIRIAVAVAHGIDNRLERPPVTMAWHEAWAAARQDGASYPNAQSHPRVRPWRERFRALGVSGKQFPSSIEALLRRALKDQTPFSINPLVDFYNSVSLRHTVPAGAFDLDDLRGTLDLRLTREGDHFTALDADGAVDVPPGEVAYVDGQTVLTRHFVWRQSRTGLITPSTRSAILIAEILGELEDEVAPAVVEDFVRGLREHFGVEPVASVVDAQAPAVAW